MITKKQYDYFRDSGIAVRHWRGKDIAQDVALSILIESLRTVARAAEVAWPLMFEDIPKALNSKRAKYEHLYEALDALPQWVLEENDEPTK